VIYLDTSVLLAQLFSETRRPPSELWNHTLVSSRLLEYESWNRVHAYALGDAEREGLRALLATVAFVELEPSVLQRALEPFERPVRTLDALHLASAAFVRTEVGSIAIASYDDRLLAAAATLDLEAYSLP